jgi:hypothetical protein
MPRIPAKAVSPSGKLRGIAWLMCAIEKILNIGDNLVDL